MTVSRKTAGRRGGRRRYPSAWAAGVVLLAVVGWLAVAATGDRQGDLAASDPAGARACQRLQQWLRDGRPTHEFELAKAIGPDASAARTEAIRAAASGIADVPRSPGTTHDFDGYVFVDVRRLHDACRAAGVGLAPYH